MIADSLKPYSAVISIWGFGSFFRGELYKDIDVLVVVSVSEDQLLDTSRKLRAALSKVEDMVGVPIDPLILTKTEFESRPLRNMGELVCIGLYN